MNKHRILLGAVLIICIAINVSVNFDGGKKLTSSLNSLITQAYADGEDGGDLNSLTTQASANGEDGGDDGGPNWVYLEKLSASSIYDTVVEVEGGTKFIIEKLPVGLKVKAIYNDHLVAQAKNCKPYSISRCDQNKVGIFPVNL